MHFHFLRKGWVNMHLIVYSKKERTWMKERKKEKKIRKKKRKKEMNEWKNEQTDGRLGEWMNERNEQTKGRGIENKYWKKNIKTVMPWKRLLMSEWSTGNTRSFPKCFDDYKINILISHCSFTIFQCFTWYFFSHSTRNSHT